MPKTARLWTMILMVIMLAVGGCGRTGQAVKPQVNTPGPVSSSNIRNTNTTPNATSPLTGSNVDPRVLEQRPLMVMIDNASTARPHYGLSKADLLYEMLVEGGITRIMAVFHSQSAETIGPVRSVRPAFLDKAMELGGVLVHCGGSEDALQSIPRLGIRDIDEIAWSAPFWRDPKRDAPHNLFTSSGNLVKAVASRPAFAGGFSQHVLAFAEVVPVGQPGKQLLLRYPAGYTVSYQYNAEQKVYGRFMNGQPHVDAAHGARLTAANVIVEIVPVKVLDNEGRLEFASVGKGDAYVLCQGVVRKGQWVKESQQAMTRVLDTDGKELTLTPGVTWVQLVALASSVEIK